MRLLAEKDAEKDGNKGPVGVEHLLNALSQEIRGPAAVVRTDHGDW